jgi:hypothetical protein
MREHGISDPVLLGTADLPARYAFRVRTTPGRPVGPRATPESGK